MPGLDRLNKVLADPEISKEIEKRAEALGITADKLRLLIYPGRPSGKIHERFRSALQRQASERRLYCRRASTNPDGDKKDENKDGFR